MSWWVYLEPADGGEAVPVAPHEEGGTFVLGGVAHAELNVTYNYGAPFREAWPEPLEGSGALALMLNGRTAGETEPLLAAAVEKLGTDRDPDYWRPTEGNAGHALSILLAWARQHPDAVWRIS